MTKITNKQFAKWIKDNKLTHAYVGEYLGFKINRDKYMCATVSRMLSGKWAGWNSPQKVEWLAFKVNNWIKK